MANGRISLCSPLKVAISYTVLVFWPHGVTLFPLLNLPVNKVHSSRSTVHIMPCCGGSLKCCGHIVCVRFTVKGYYGFRACRYSNSDSTFNLSRLVVSRDICAHPGPSRKPCCQVSFRAVAINHRQLVCATCGSNYHMKCGDVKPEEFIRIQENIFNWICGQCTFESTFPFASLSNTSFLSSVGLEERNIPNESSIDAEPTESHLGDLLASLDYFPKYMSENCPHKHL